MGDYKIGEIIKSKEEQVLEEAFTGEKVTIPAGNKVIIGADKRAHHIRTGMIQPLKENATVEGYDEEGLAEYLYLCLRCRFPIDEMIDDYDLELDKFKNEIEYALNEIGFW